MSCALKLITAFSETSVKLSNYQGLIIYELKIAKENLGITSKIMKIIK